MPLTPEQIKDLHPFKASEMKTDMKFYIKQDNGEFEAAKVSQWEYDTMKKNKPWLIEQMRWELLQLENAGKLFK